MQNSRLSKDLMGKSVRRPSIFGNYAADFPSSRLGNNFLNILNLANNSTPGKNGVAYSTGGGIRRLGLLLAREPTSKPDSGETDKNRPGPNHSTGQHSTGIVQLGLGDTTAPGTGAMSAPISGNLFTSHPGRGAQDRAVDNILSISLRDMLHNSGRVAALQAAAHEYAVDPADRNRVDGRSADR